MAVTALLNTKVKFMPAEKTIIVDRGTAISVSLAIPLIAGLVYLATSLTTLQSHMDYLQTEIQSQKIEMKEIQNGYVSKNELVLQLKNIEDKLSNIENTLKGK